MADKVILTVGTKRGLFLLESNRSRGRWNLRGPYLKGWTVHHAMIDTRGKPRIHACAANFTYASSTFSAGLSGKDFKGAETPPVAPSLPSKAMRMAKQWGLDTSARLWAIAPGPVKEPKVLYAGTAPAGLFRSEDTGKTWQPVDALNKHRSRKDWMSGAGGMSLHSIQQDPHDANRLYVGISAAGAFRTDDAGQSFKPINSCVAEYVGAPAESTVGTCVHKLLAHPTTTGRLYQQNHVGVYRSDDHGDSWQRIDAGLPHDFGFGLALNANDPDTCYVIPLEPQEYAFRATDGALGVYRLNKNGRGWKKLAKGLPSKNAYVSVLRQAMTSDALDPCGVYFGTAGGHLFASADEGASWQTVAEFLPPIFSVSAAIV